MIVSHVPTSNHRRRRTRREPPPLEEIDPDLDISIGQHIFRALRRALMAGRIGATDGLSIRGIADSLGVSPAPVRDALKQLEACGVLVARNKSAFFVAPLDVRTFDELETVRVELEGFAAGLAALNADARDVRSIVEANDRYVDATLSNPGDSTAANHAFHFAIYHASCNETLVGLIENLWLRMGPLLSTAHLSYDFVSARDHHRKLIEAIRRRDGDAARDAMRRDISEAGQSIRIALFGSAPETQ